jgi:hypothetical protein
MGGGSKRSRWSPARPDLARRDRKGAPGAERAGREGQASAERRGGEDLSEAFDRLKRLIEETEAELKVEEEKTKNVKEDFEEKSKKVEDLKKEIVRRNSAQEAARKKETTDIEMEKFLKVMPEMLSKVVKGPKTEALKLALKEEKIKKIQESREAMAKKETMAIAEQDQSTNAKEVQQAVQILEIVDSEEES